MPVTSRRRADDRVGAELGRGRRGMREAMEGLRFVRSEPVLLGAISLDLVRGAVRRRGRAASRDRRRPARRRCGRARIGSAPRSASAPGCVTLLLTRPSRSRRRVGRTLLVAVAVFGVGTIVLGVTTSFVVAFVALARACRAPTR